MPFALVTIGLILVIAAYNNAQDTLAAQFKKDIAGKTGFIYWVAAIIIVGAIGYFAPMKSASRAMLGLILVVVFLKNGGIFEKFNEALSQSAGGGAPAGEATAAPEKGAKT